RVEQNSPPPQLDDSLGDVFGETTRRHTPRIARPGNAARSTNRPHGAGNALVTNVRMRPINGKHRQSFVSRSAPMKRWFPLAVLASTTALWFAPSACAEDKGDA